MCCVFACSAFPLFTGLFLCWTRSELKWCCWWCCCCCRWTLSLLFVRGGPNCRCCCKWRWLLHWIDSIAFFCCCCCCCLEKLIKFYGQKAAAATPPFLLPFSFSFSSVRSHSHSRQLDGDIKGMETVTAWFSSHRGWKVNIGCETVNFNCCCCSLTH